MSNLDRDALNTGLDAMARQIESALDYDVAKRRQEGLETTPDTHLYSPPSWPSHGCLRHWIKALDEARKLLSASPAVTVTEGWKPIETAPKMKTILLFAVTLRDNDGAVRNWHMATGSYHDGWEGVGDQRNYSPWVWDGHHIPPYGHLPTHWQPLPPPPSTTPQTGSQE